MAQDFVLFAEPGKRFEIVPLPNDQPRRLPGTPVSLYPTTDGFGIAGNPPNETADFETWVEVNTGKGIDPMMATRGNERVFRSFGSVQRFGPNDPVLGMAYSPDNGETWQDINDNINALYGPEIGSPLSFLDLQAGPGGWAATAQRQLRGAQTPVVGVELDNNSGPSDFVVTALGFELAGHTPFGPATLTGPEGQVIRTWEHLEVRRPQLSGFVLRDQAVVLVDEDTGADLVSFTIEQWAALNVPGVLPGNYEYDVLFSADGVDWAVVYTSPLPPQILTVAEEAVVVRTVDATPFAQGWDSSVAAIPITGGD